MPDTFYKTVLSIIQPPCLVEITTVTRKTETVLVAPDGTRTPQEPVTTTETIEKWSVKAMVETEWTGVTEEEFFRPTESACAVIRPGYKEAY